jgi:hypothetical protein
MSIKIRRRRIPSCGQRAFEPRSRGHLGSPGQAHVAADPVDIAESFDKAALAGRFSPKVLPHPVPLLAGLRPDFGGLEDGVHLPKLRSCFLSSVARRWKDDPSSPQSGQKEKSGPKTSPQRTQIRSPVRGSGKILWSHKGLTRSHRFQYGH